MWLAFPVLILPFIILERVKIKEEKKKPVTHRSGKAFESDRSRHPE